jgi:hypothetical protein
VAGEQGKKKCMDSNLPLMQMQETWFVPPERRYTRHFDKIWFWGAQTQMVDADHYVTQQSPDVSVSGLTSIHLPTVISSYSLR